MPPDGPETQDGARAAGTRGIPPPADGLVPPPVTWRGDALSSKPPFGALALQQGGHCRLVCQPAAPPKLSERWALWPAPEARGHGAQRPRQGRGTAGARSRFLNDVLRQDGQPALAVKGVAITLATATTGAPLYDHTLSTNHRLRTEHGAQVAQGGRGRWKSANENPNGLKPKGDHREPHGGHGKQYRAVPRLSRNLLACLCHTGLAWSAES